MIDRFNQQLQKYPIDNFNKYFEFKDESICTSIQKYSLFHFLIITGERKLLSYSSTHILDSKCLVQYMFGILHIYIVTRP